MGPMRKAAVIIAIVVTSAILGAAAVPRLVSMEAYRPRVAAAIAAKTGRTASFSKISLTLLPAIAIRLSDFSLSGPAEASAEPLVSSPVAEFRVALLPFLAGRNEFSTLFLHRPKITVRKYPDGTHSATDLIERLARLDVLAPPDAGKPTSVTLKGIRVEEGALSILGGEKGAPASRLELSPFSFRGSGIGMEKKPFSLEVGFPPHARGTVRLDGLAVHRNAAAGGGVSIRGQGEAFGQKFTAEGALSAPRDTVEADLSISFPKVDVGSLPESFPEVAGAISRLRPQGVANLAVKISGDLQSLGFEAQADLTRAGWTIAEGLSKFIDAPCTLVVEGHRFPEAIVVSNAEVRYPPLLLVGNAFFSPTTGAREYSASGRIASLAEFAKSRGEAFTKWSPAGRIVLSVKGKRATGASPDGYLFEADLAEVGITFPGRAMAVSGFNGHVSIAPESVEFSPLAGLINGQRFLLRGKIARGDGPSGEVELRMGYLDLATLLPPEEAGGKPKRREEDALSAWLAEAWNRELAFSAAVSIDAGDLWGVEFSRLDGKIRHEKGVLSLDGVRAALYGGEMVLSGALTGPGIDPGIKANVTMTGVEGGEILRVKSALGDFLSGKLFLSAEVAGNRKDLSSFLRTVTGTGSLRIVNGKLKGVDYPALAAAAVRGGKPTGTAPPGDTAFREMESRFSLGGGKARLTDLRLESGSEELVGDATIGLTDHTLELLGTLWLSQEGSKAPPWSGRGFFEAPTGETAVPLVVSGTLRSPAVAIDTTAAGRTPGRMLRGGLSGRGKR